MDVARCLSMSEGERTLEVAEEVCALLAEHGAKCAVIGAVAMAVRGYARATEDLDIGTIADANAVLPRVQEALSARGYEVTLNLPDTDDPLGGVLTVRAHGADPVQVVNYLNPWNGWVEVAKEGIEQAEPDVLPPLAVVDVAHLVALKLYAGGRKSELDILELLDRQSPETVQETRVVCERWGFGPQLSALLSRT